MQVALLITLTHARLRARQGDLRTARRIVRKILDEDPENVEARALLDSFTGRAGREAAAEARSELEPRQAADAAQLATRFREALGRTHSGTERKIARLKRWRTRIRRHVDP